MNKKSHQNALFIGLILLYLGVNNGNGQSCLAHFSWTQVAANHLSFNDSSSTGTNFHTNCFWSFGDGYNSIGQSPTHGYSAPGTYTVCLTISDSVGCHNTFCDTVHVTGSVTCNLLVSTHSHSSSCATCHDGSAFVANISGGTAPYSYSWSPSGATTDTLSGLAPGTYTVCVFDANGCHSCNSVIIGHSTSGCHAHYTWHQPGANHLTFNDSASTGTSSTTNYYWDFGNGQYGNGQNPTHGYNNPGTYTFCDTVHVSGSVICTMSIAAHSRPASCGTCHDGSGYVASITGGTSPYSYSWSLSGATTDTLTGLVPGTYTVCVFDANGCHACTSVTITHAASCSAFYTLQADSIHPGNYLATNLSHGNSHLIYTWSWGDSSHDSTATPHHTYLGAGLYHICLTITDSTGCTSTYCDTLTAARLANWAATQHTTVNVIMPAGATGIDENHILNNWNIFPNPSKGLTTIAYSLNQNSNVRISVFDIVGREVISLADFRNQNSGIYEIKFDANSLNIGTYLIRIIANNDVETKRLTLVR
jgi:PKD repeat protein